MIAAVVGAGGKTSLIHAAARQARESGKRVFVTTSTHMYLEPDTLLTDDPAPLLQRLEETGYLMAGLPRGEKLGPLSPETYAAVCRHAELVLVEADGARHRAVKLPREGEPVIPENAEEIWVVCGLHALGWPLAEAAFQPERTAAFLGASPEEPLTLSHVRRLVREGYWEPLRRQYPNKKLLLCPATDGSPEQERLSSQLRQELAL